MPLLSSAAGRCIGSTPKTSPGKGKRPCESLRQSTEWKCRERPWRPANRAKAGIT
jgi:hypothetical protein